MASAVRIAFIFALSLCHSAAAQQPQPKEPSAPAMAYKVCASDVTAVPGQVTPLAISLNLPIDRALVGIKGVPKGARLNAGVDTG
jgi:hypothetical protein